MRHLFALIWSSATHHDSPVGDMNDSHLAFSSLLLMREIDRCPSVTLLTLSWRAESCGKHRTNQDLGGGEEAVRGSRTSGGVAKVRTFFLLTLSPLPKSVVRPFILFRKNSTRHVVE